MQSSLLRENDSRNAIVKAASQSLPYKFLEMQRQRDEQRCGESSHCMPTLVSKLWLRGALQEAEKEQDSIASQVTPYAVCGAVAAVVVSPAVIQRARLPSASSCISELTSTEPLTGKPRKVSRFKFCKGMIALTASTMTSTALGEEAKSSQQDILRRMYGLATTAEENKDAAVALKQRLVKAGERQGARFAQLRLLEGVQKENGELIKLISSGQAEVDAILLEVTTGLQDLVAQTKCLVEREKKLVCWLKYLDCRLRGLACAIRAAIRRAFVKGFIIGFIIGLGLGIGLAGAGGGAGALSVGFF